MLTVQGLILGQVRRVGDDEVLFEIQERGDFTDGECVQHYCGNGDVRECGHGYVLSRCEGRRAAGCVSPADERRSSRLA